MASFNAKYSSSPLPDFEFDLDKPPEFLNAFLPPYNATDSLNVSSGHAIRVQVQLHGRILQELEQNQHVKTVRGTLYGVIRTQVGEYTAQQKFLRMTSDFILSKTNPTSFPSATCQSSVESIHTCFPSLMSLRQRYDRSTYDITLSSPCLLPTSGLLSGSTWISQSTALKDHHQVSGQCEVAYYADLNCLVDTKQMSACDTYVLGSSKIDLNVEPSSIEIRSTTMKGRKRRGTLMQACMYTLSKAVSHECPCPELTFQIPRDVKQDLERPPSTRDGRQKLIIPLSVSIKLPQPESERHAMLLTVLRHRLLQRGIVDFGAVSAAYRMKSSFGVGQDHEDYKIDKEDIYIVAKDHVIDLPPFYQDGELFVAATELHFLIPTDLLRKGNIDLDLLQIKQILSLTLITKQLDAELPGLLPAYSAQMTMRCHLQ